MKKWKSHLVKQDYQKQKIDFDNSPAKLDSLHICGESRKHVTCDFLDSGKIGIETLMQAFSFFSGMTQDEKSQMIKAYKNGEFDRHKGQNFWQQERETAGICCIFLFFLLALYFRYSILAFHLLPAKPAKNKRKGRRQLPANLPLLLFLNTYQILEYLTKISSFAFLISLFSSSLMTAACTAAATATIIQSHILHTSCFRYIIFF